MEFSRTGFTLRPADWLNDREALQHVRFTVFVDEQQVPAEIEIDEHDPGCYHVLAEDEVGTPIGTGRLLDDGHIGRMAVLQAWRGRGVGSALLMHLKNEARRRGFKRAILSSQVHAMAFYARHGFQAYGAVYLDAGIDHRDMECAL